MDELKRLGEKLEDLTLLPYDVFPDIDLYMDQVLGYVARKPGSFRDDDRLTSAMVNNYVKAGILPRAKGKKYTHEHLAYLMLISRLKQVLSVKDTGVLLSAVKGDKGDRDFYEGFDRLVGESVEQVRDEIGCSEEDLAAAALRLAVESYLRKVVCESIIDHLAAEYSPPDKKQKSAREKADKGPAKEAAAVGEKKA